MTERPSTPIGMSGPNLTYDRARHRLVLLGNGGSVGSNPVHDTYTMAEFDGTQWVTSAPAATSPNFSVGEVFVYDEQEAQCFEFGEGGYNELDRRTWLWNGTRWEDTSGTIPWVTNFAYDSDRDRVVLLAEEDHQEVEPAGYVQRTTTWELAGGVWTRLSPAHFPRRTSSMIYDPMRKKTLLFGDGIEEISNETWEWDGVDWTKLAPPQSPPLRTQPSLVVDRARGRILMLGGDTPSVALGDFWAWDGTTWSPLPNPSFPPRDHPSLAYDEARDRLVLHGDLTLSAVSADPADTWEWDGTTWKQLAALDALPRSFRRRADRLRPGPPACHRARLGLQRQRRERRRRRELALRVGRQDLGVRRDSIGHRRHRLAALRPAPLQAGHARADAGRLHDRLDNRRRRAGRARRRQTRRRRHARRRHAGSARWRRNGREWRARRRHAGSARWRRNGRERRRHARPARRRGLHRQLLPLRDGHDRLLVLRNRRVVLAADLRRERPVGRNDLPERL